MFAGVVSVYNGAIVCGSVHCKLELVFPFYFSRTLFPLDRLRSVPE